MFWIIFEDFMLSFFLENLDLDDFANLIVLTLYHVIFYFWMNLIYMLCATMSREKLHTQFFWNGVG